MYKEIKVELFWLTWGRRGAGQSPEPHLVTLSLTTPHDTPLCAAAESINYAGGSLNYT